MKKSFIFVALVFTAFTCNAFAQTFVSQQKHVSTYSNKAIRTTEINTLISTATSLEDDVIAAQTSLEAKIATLTAQITALTPATCNAATGVKPEWDGSTWVCKSDVVGTFTAPTASWTTGSWSTCSGACGGGSGTQSRSVTCPTGYDCSGSPKPSATQACINSTPCVGLSCIATTVSWNGLDNNCSANVSASTHGTAQNVTDSSGRNSGKATFTCDNGVWKKQSGQTCDENQWKAGTWGSCSGGVQTRAVSCIRTVNGATAPDSSCPTSLKPATSQSCAPVYTYSWSTGSWSTCSKTCGGGTQTRTVVCKRSDGVNVADSNCSGTKPTTSQACNTTACATDCRYSFSGHMGKLNYGVMEDDASRVRRTTMHWNGSSTLDSSYTYTKGRIRYGSDRTLRRIYEICRTPK